MISAPIKAAKLEEFAKKSGRKKTRPPTNVPPRPRSKIALIPLSDMGLQRRTCFGKSGGAYLRRIVLDQGSAFGRHPVTQSRIVGDFRHRGGEFGDITGRNEASIIAN